MLKYLKNKDVLLHESVVQFQNYKNKKQNLGQSSSPRLNKTEAMEHSEDKMQ